MKLIECLSDSGSKFSHFIQIFTGKKDKTHASSIFAAETPEELKLPFANRVYQSVAPFVNSVPISGYFLKQETWNLYQNIKATQEQILAYGWWCEGTSGVARYDWRGVLSFPLRFIEQNKHKYFCTEHNITGMVLTKILSLLDARKSPAWFDAYLKENDDWVKVIEPV